MIASAETICTRATKKKTSTTTRSCRDQGTAVIHCWLPGGVRRWPQRVTPDGSGGRRGTLRRPPPPLLLRPGAKADAGAAAAGALSFVESHISHFKIIYNFIQNY